MSGYFELFGLPEHLLLDTAALQRKLYELSRQYHPDRFATAGAAEQQQALDTTSRLNDGYRILRDPVRRAEYVLKSHGFDIGEQRSKDVPPELLEEVFELNMALEELRGGDNSAAGALRESAAHFAGMLKDVDAQLDQLFARHDQAPLADRQALLAEIRAVLNRRRYIQNLLAEVDKEVASV